MTSEATHPEARILVVDDEASIVRLLTRALQNAGYTNVAGYTDPQEALESIEEALPDLIVLDVNMPGMSGYDFLTRLSEHLRADVFLPVLMISGLPEPDTRLQALEAGAMNFLTKPIDLGVFLAAVKSLLETRFLSLRLYMARGVLEKLVQKRTEELRQAHLELLERLAKVAEYRDDATGRHTERVGELCRMLAEELGLPPEQVVLIARTAPLHDLGKVAIPDVVLLKQGPFNDDEREIMRRHSVLGAEILSGGTSELVQMAEEIALCHHERWDGRGYPRGLKGEQIPLAARIVAVADSFDALIHKRPYKEAWTIPDAMAEMRRERGGQFDPQVVDALFRLYERGQLDFLTEDQFAA
ncbi:MAG: response regulator [Thermoleophilia bacterium]|nr:response regulator [Thermoleophilia bacterium]